MRDLFAVTNLLVKPGSPGGVGLALRPPWRLFVLTELQKNYSTVCFLTKFDGKMVHGPRKKPSAFDGICVALRPG